VKLVSFCEKVKNQLHVTRNEMEIVNKNKEGGGMQTLFLSGIIIYQNTIFSFYELSSFS
jgi:hypothetical protein